MDVGNYEIDSILYWREIFSYIIYSIITYAFSWQRSRAVPEETTRVRLNSCLFHHEFKMQNVVLQKNCVDVFVKRGCSLRASFFRFKIKVKYLLNIDMP